MNTWSIRVVAGVLAMLSIAAPRAAFAADMPLKAKAPPHAVASWTGFYLGLGLGFRSTETKGTLVGASATSGGGTFDLFDFCVAVPCAMSEPINGTAFRVAPYAGFNWQFAPQWLVGLEVDWGWAARTVALSGLKYPATASNAFVSGQGVTGDSFAVRTTWDASARARLGFLVNPWFLLYATGGAAWLHLETASNCNTASVTAGGISLAAVCGGTGLLNPANISHSTDRLGWTVGAGGEVMLWSNWVARAEYRYADFGTVRSVDTRSCSGAGIGVTPCILGGTQTVVYDVQVRTHLATFGLAYRFGDAAYPPAGAAYAAAKALVTKAPLAPAASWAGLYVGLGLGLRATDTVGTSTLRTFNPPFVGGTDVAAFCAAAGCALSEPLHGTALRVSPYVGFNWQLDPRWVVGVEADWGWANRTVALSGTTYPATFTFNSGDSRDTFEVRTTWDASLRARAGVLVTPVVLAYATGGAAWLHLDSTSNCVTTEAGCGPGGFTPGVIAHSATRLGWTVGAGGEALLWSNWVARAEYRYADFGTIAQTDVRLCPAANCGGVERTVTVGYDLRVRTHTATFGLAYRFDWAGPLVARF
jgi:outer membrane immunogenic protein